MEQIRFYRNSETRNIFKLKILKFIRTIANSIFDCHNPIGVTLLTILRLGLSHLCEHKSKHNFQDKLACIFFIRTNFEK